MRSGRFAVAAVLVVVGWTAATGVAAAHDELISSTPADGQAVPASPAAVELEFAGALRSFGDQPVAVVTDSAGAVVSAGDAEIDGPYARQPLAADLPDGEYQVAYSVISSDGHRVEGTTRFFVGSVPAGSEPAAPEQTAGPSQAALAGDPAEDGNETGVPGIVLVIAGGVAVVVVAVLVLRRSRREQGPT